LTLLTESRPQVPISMTVDPDSRLQLLRSERENAFGSWLEADAQLSSALDHLRQLRAAKAEALKARGISPHQLAQFRRREQGKVKPTDYRTLASYAQHRNIIASIDRRWDGAITTAQVEVDRATTDLAIVTADLLSTTPSALANKLTGLSVRRLSTIVRATANTHAAS